MSAFSPQTGSNLGSTQVPAPAGRATPRVSAGRQSGAHPIWSRNGRELFYKGAGASIMVVTSTTKSDSFAADESHPWANVQILDPNANLSSLDLAPDGKRFAVFPKPEGTGEQKGSVHVTFLLNFFDELRRHIPAGGK